MYSEETHLAKLIIATNGTIATNCKSFLVEKPSNFKLYQEYLHNLNFSGGPIGAFLTKAADVCEEGFIESYEEFSSFYPQINLSLESPPKRPNGGQYFTDLIKLDWHSELIKVTLNYYIQKILSEFINEMIYIEKAISADEIKKIIISILSYIKSLREPQSEYEISMGIEAMEIWSLTINLLSSINSKVVSLILSEEVLKNNEINDYHQAYIYLAFSSMILDQELSESYTVYIQNLIQKLSSKGSNHLFCTSLAKFLHSLFFQNAKIQKVSINSNIAQTLFQILVTQLDFNNESFSLAAHLSNYLKNTIFSTMSQYIDYYPKVKPEMRSYYLEGIVFKLYGDNFATPIEIKHNRSNYKWFTKNSHASQDAIFKFMANNDDTLEEFGDELSIIVEQMIISDISYFTKVILPKMDDLQNTKVSICASLYKGLKLFFSNMKYFIDMNLISSQSKRGGSDENEEEEEEEEECESSSESKSNDKYISKLSEKVRLLVSAFLAKREKKPCTVSYDTASLTALLLVAASENDKNSILDDNIKFLSETSKPIFTEEEQINDISSYTNQFGNAYLPVKIEENPETPEYISDPTKGFNPDLQNVLALTVFIKPSDEIIQLMVDTLLMTSPLNGSMIMRCFQALIHIDASYAPLIIGHLCNYFIYNKIDKVVITLIINSIYLAIESTYYDKITLPNETMSKICFASILGFCVPEPNVHQKVFDICQTLMYSKPSIFYLQLLFDRYHQEISFNAIRRAAQAVLPISDNDTKFLSQPSFHHVSLSNYPIFYLFYLSSLGRFIHEYNEGFEYSIKYLTKVLSEKLFSISDNEEYFTYFTMNCLALLLSIAENLDVFKTYQIKRICLIFLRKYSVDNGEENKETLSETEINNSVTLIALFSGITPSLYQSIMPLFAQSSFTTCRTFTFLTHEMIFRNSLTCINNHQLSNVVYTVLHASLILIFRRFISPKQLFLTNINRLTMFSPLHLFLNNFSEALGAVFKNIAEVNKPKLKPLFICYNTQMGSIINHPFNTMKWFVFFCNLMTYTESIFCDNLMDAFNGWLGISQIPDKYFRTFMQKLPSIGKLYPDISTTIFRCNPSNRLPFYIIHARKNFHMFMAIANQIAVEGVPSENKVSETISFRFGNIETIYYHNCGSLIALALFNMISKRIERRLAGLKFLSAMVVIIGVFRNDPSTTAQICKFIETIKPAMLNSFSIFLKRDFVELNSLLASKFKFCGEQFANECFSIVRTKETTQINQKALPSFPSLNQVTQGKINIKSIMLKPITTARNRKTDKSFLLNNNNIDLQSSFNRFRMANEEPDRYSVRKSWNTVMGSNVQLLSMQKQTQKYDQINVEKPQILTSLIAEWLNPISFDLQKIGISRDCDEEYRVFGIYSFVNGLLILCSAQGMTKPLADILDILIEDNHELLTLCLYDLQAKSPSHAKSATLFLVYLYNKKPEAFIMFIREYLRVTSWYFYEIQSSKVDQLYDISKILGNSGIMAGRDSLILYNARYKQSGTPPITDKSGSENNNNNNNNNNNSNNNNNTNDDPQDTYEIDYLQVINFTLNLIEECRKENAERLAEIRSLTLIFCLIHNSTFSENADILISNITKLKPNTQAAVAAHAFIVSQNQIAETWKMSDVTPFIDGGEQFLLEWGLTCGDLAVATKALQIFELKSYVIPSEAIPTMLNAMQSISTALNERTNPAKKNQFNQWILRIAGDDMRVNYEAIVNWLDQCLILLRRHAITTIQKPQVIYSQRPNIRKNTSFVFDLSRSTNQKFKSSLMARDDEGDDNSEEEEDKKASILQESFLSKTMQFVGPQTGSRRRKNRLSQSSSLSSLPDDHKEIDSTLIKTFWTATAFLQCHSLEYSSLFISALKIVDLFMSKEQLINLLKEKRTNCRIKSGIIPLLLEAKASDIYSINSIFTILSCILENDLIYLLSPKKEAACIAIVALLPWIWMRFNRQDINSKYCSTLTRLVSTSIDNEDSLFEFKDALEQIGHYQTATPSSVVAVFRHLYSIIEPEDIILIFSFFIQVAKIGTVSQKECVFILCDSLFDQKDFEIPKKLVEVISMITYYAVTDVSIQNSPYVLKFLKNLAQNNNRVTTPQAVAHGRVYTAFPKMEIGFYYYNNDYVDIDEAKEKDHDYNLKYDKSKLAEWEPNTVDVFADYSFYPPLLITDPGFNGSVFLKGIKKAIDKIVTVPFNEWYDQLFRAQLQNVTTSIQIKSERFATVEVQAKEFVENFTEDMGNAKNKSRRLTPDKRRWQAILENISNMENDESLDFAVHSDQFFISKAHIDSLIH